MSKPYILTPHRFLVATYMATLITSAALLFWLQPMIAKFILPRVGGAPQVWNTAMMFFQAALLAGYLYAHVLTRHAPIRIQVATHLALLLVCLAWLPIAIPPASLPPGGGNPSGWVLSALALSIGVPFTVVSGSAPLLQSWFAASDHKDAENPYFLYAASNVGSMSALFAFPLIAEPMLDLPGQSLAWSLAFAVLVVLSAFSGRLALKTSKPSVTALNVGAERSGDAPTSLQRFLWVALLLASTSLMLGITTYITTNVAAVPLLWVVPLALYLLTFILAFARRPLISPQRSLHVLLAALIVFGIVWAVRDALSLWLAWTLALMVVYFVTVLACHTQLAQIKPHKSWLTEFYLWIALGGVLGGSFNALLAPVLFQGATEFEQMLGVALALILATSAFQRRDSTRMALVLALASLVLPLGADHAGLFLPKNTITRERNFFGVLTVQNDAEINARILGHGTTVHGMRDLRAGHNLEPVGYYGRTSPLGDVMAELLRRPKMGDIAAIGLGVGSISCYPTGGRSFQFFEINPAVTRLAEHPGYFDFLKDCGAHYRVKHGDGRLRIADAPPASFDLIFLDAFTSDSIPVHLLTRQAVEIYRDKLTPGGLILAHISNNHLDLAPVLSAIARDLGMVAFERTRLGGDANSGSNRLLDAQVEMVVLAANLNDLGPVPTLPGWHQLHSDGSARAWTDSYTNIVGALRIFKNW